MSSFLYRAISASFAAGVDRLTPQTWSSCVLTLLTPCARSCRTTSAGNSFAFTIPAPIAAISDLAKLTREASVVSASRLPAVSSSAKISSIAGGVFTSSKAPSPRNASRRNAGCCKRLRNTTGNWVSRADTNADNASRLSVRDDLSSSTTIRNVVNATLLPNVNESDRANCRTSSFGACPSRAATASQPFGGLRFRCPFNAAAIPLRISSWNSESSDSFKTPTNAPSASASCARVELGCHSVSVRKMNNSRFMAIPFLNRRPQPCGG